MQGVNRPRNHFQHCVLQRKIGGTGRRISKLFDFGKEPIILQRLKILCVSAERGASDVYVARINCFDYLSKFLRCDIDSPMPE